MPDPAHVVQSTPADDTMELIGLVAADAATILNVSLDDSPQSIVAAVNECVRDIQKGEGPELDEEEEDIVMLLGALWGNQLVKGLSWEWANIDINEGDEPFAAIGVVSPTRNMVIYPFNFVAGCLENGITSTILLAYNMLVEKADDVSFEPGTYENVMSYVHHIVPPE